MGVLQKLNIQDLFINLDNPTNGALIRSGTSNTNAAPPYYTQNDIVFQRLFFFKVDTTNTLVNWTFPAGTYFGVGGVSASAPSAANLFGSQNFAPLTDTATSFAGYGGNLNLMTDDVDNALGSSTTLPIILNVQAMDAPGNLATARLTVATATGLLGYDAYNDAGTFKNPTLLAGLTGLFRPDITKGTGGANALESIVTTGIARPSVGIVMASVQFYNSTLATPKNQTWNLFYTTDNSNPGPTKVVPLDFDAVANPCVWILQS